VTDLGATIRAEFPLFSKDIDGHPIVYLDTAATAQKPRTVIDAMTTFYEQENANVKRGMHVLAERSTEAFEAARTRVQKFLHAKTAREIIFTKNCTESINLVARSWGEKNLRKGDVVLLSLLEHHSNIVPWLQLKEKIGIGVEWIGIEDDGMLKMDDAKKIFKQGKVKFLSLTCVSNVLGIKTPTTELTKLAHAHGALVLLDAAQLAPHAPIDVQALDCDFLAFSGHKVYGPTGIGVLYGKEKFLEAMPPFLGGGTMIQEVFTDRFTPSHLPEKFEAGTPPIAEAVGLHAAIDFLEGIGWEKIQKYEQTLLAYALKKLSEIDELIILGPKDPECIASCISFICTTGTPTSYKLQATSSIHPHDLTEYCGRKGVCLRAGHHCAQPLHHSLGHPATTRMSFGIYTTKEEIDQTCTIIREAIEFFTASNLA